MKDTRARSGAPFDGGIAELLEQLRRNDVDLDSVCIPAFITSAALGRALADSGRIDAWLVRHSSVTADGPLVRTAAALLVALESTLESNERTRLVLDEIWVRLHERAAGPALRLEIVYPLGGLDSESGGAIRTAADTLRQGYGLEVNLLPDARHEGDGGTSSTSQARGCAIVVFKRATSVTIVAIVAIVAMVVINQWRTTTEPDRPAPADPGQPGPKVAAWTITSPANGDTVRSPSITLRGTAAAGNDDDIWIFVVPDQGGSQMWPQSPRADEGLPAYRLPGNQWTGPASLGGPPQRYDLVLFTSPKGSEASRWIADTLREWARTNGFLGLAPTQVTRWPELREQLRITITRVDP